MNARTSPVGMIGVFFATLLIINLPLAGVLQAAILLILWGLAFRPLNGLKIAMFVVVNVVYVIGVSTL